MICLPFGEAAKYGLGFLQPGADGAFLEVAARYAVSGIVEARAAVAPLARANAASSVALVLAMSDL